MDRPVNKPTTAANVKPLKPAYVEQQKQLQQQQQQQLEEKEEEENPLESLD